MHAVPRDTIRSARMSPQHRKSYPKLNAVPAARPTGRVLLVDDDPQLPRAFGRILRSAGFVVEHAIDGTEAVAAIKRGGLDVVISDIDMPGLDGIQLLRIAHTIDADLPLVLITGSPAVETAIAAVEHGALRYLVKPVPPQQLTDTVTEAAALRRMALVKREAAALAALTATQSPLLDRPQLGATLDRALDSLWMAYQPIVAVETRRIFACEALVRSGVHDMAEPAAIFDAAEALQRVYDVGRRVRGSVAATAAQHPDICFFVNLHPRDLLDEELFDAAAPLSQIATRVVLEVTERASLEHVTDLRGRVATLRKIGYCVAIDDLGAGYAGLASFATLEPEVVKIDMSLVREIHGNATKRKLVGSMVSLCDDLGMRLVVEGVETVAERAALIELGCDLMQGYLFARPAGLPSTIQW
jgi:EAL domain-containing protein (putative c-di-GMP-specific phosphodiesterase class I)/ActR/RegA family two-component response regulator